MRNVKDLFCQTIVVAAIHKKSIYEIFMVPEYLIFLNYGRTLKWTTVNAMFNFNKCFKYYRKYECSQEKSYSYHLQVCLKFEILQSC